MPGTLSYLAFIDAVLTALGELSVPKNDSTVRKGKVGETYVLGEDSFL